MIDFQIGNLHLEPIIKHIRSADVYSFVLTWRQLDLLLKISEGYKVSVETDERQWRDLYTKGLVSREGLLTKAGEAVVYLLKTNVGEQHE